MPESALESQESLFGAAVQPALPAVSSADHGAFCGCQAPRPEDLSHLTKREHPAKFSEGIVETMAQMLFDRAGCVFDPFAGTGRLRELEALGPWCVHTVEYEPEWAMWDPLTWLGDARNLPFEDERFPVIATSPTYGNGLGQRRHHPNLAGKGKRYAYPDHLRRDMTPGNTGAVRWGKEYRQLHLLAWEEQVRILAPKGRLLLNFRDSLKKDILQPISGWHMETLVGLGLTFVGAAAVATSGMRAGKGNNPLGSGEVIFAFDKL